MSFSYPKTFVLFVTVLAACGPARTPMVTLSTSTPPPTARPAPTQSESLTLGNWHDMIYHAEVGRVILVNGGPETGKPAADPVELWAWDGESWSLLSRDPEGPRWRNFASIAYDTKQNSMILYGGLTAEKEYADTWAWDGKDWTQFPVEGPGPREAAGMTYDSLRDRSVLFGGAQFGRMLNDTWEWDGNQWTQMAIDGPEARFPAGFVFDAVRHDVLLFGGHAIDGQGFRTYGDTWTWDGAAWREVAAENPSPRDGARTVYMPITGWTLLFGGARIDANVTHLNDTWLWNGTVWEHLLVEGPSPRVHAAMAFDLKRDIVVMTGGSNGPDAIFQDTWEWDGRIWVCMDKCK